MTKQLKKQLFDLAKELRSHSVSKLHINRFEIHNFLFLFLKDWEDLTVLNGHLSDKGSLSLRFNEKCV